MSPRGNIYNITKEFLKIIIIILKINQNKKIIVYFKNKNKLEKIVSAISKRMAYSLKKVIRI